MIIMKKYFITIIGILITVMGYAQQNTQFNQYIFNKLMINPAYAGTKGMIYANAIYSKQWAGVDGAPKMQTICIDGPASEKVGLGFHLINDKIGAQSQQGFFGSYSYKIQLNETFRLSMGLAAGASNFTINGSEMTTTLPDDPAVPKSTIHKFVFDSKAGLLLFSERFYAGFSVSDLFANSFKKEGFPIQQVRHYYFMSGYVFDLFENLKFKPSFLLKHAAKSPSNIDLNALFLYREKFWLGASLRFGSGLLVNADLDNTLRNRDALILVTDYNITEKLRVGYAYTFSTSVFKTNPSHELSIGYFVPGKVPAKRMMTIRYF